MEVESQNELIKRIDTDIWKIAYEDPDTKPLLNKWEAIWHKFEFFKEVDFFHNEKANKAREEKFNQLPNSHNYKLKLNRLDQALKALAALKRCSTFSAEAKQEIEHALMLCVQTEITALEISQLKRLRKAQEMHSQKLLRLNEELKQLSLLRKERLRNSAHYLALLDSKDLDSKDLKDFYEARLHHFRFNKPAHITGDTAEWLGVIESFASFNMKIINKIVRVGEKAAEAMDHVLSGLSKTTTALGLVPGVLNLSKTFAKDKSSKKKTAAGLALTLSVVGIALGALTHPIAVILGAALMITSLVRSEIMPFYNLKKRHKTALNEYGFLGRRAETLDNVSTLLGSEKNILLNRLQKESSHFSAQQIISAKKLIASGSIEDIDNKDPAKNQHQEGAAVIHAMLKGQSVRDFLKNRYDAQRSCLSTEIKSMDEQLKENRRLRNNGILGLIGVGLLLFPNPIVALVGAGLLLTHSIIGLEIKYHLSDKVKAWFSKKETQPAGTPTLADAKKSTLSSTALLNKEIAAKPVREPKIAPVIAPVVVDNSSRLSVKAPSIQFEEPEVFATPVFASAPRA